MHSDREKLVERLRYGTRDVETGEPLDDGAFAHVTVDDIRAVIAALAPVEAVPVAWHRSTDGAGSILLYTLRQDGWRRGEPVMVNDAMVRVEAANGSQTPIEPIAERILSALTRPAGERPAVAVEALREAVREALIFYENHGAGCRLVHSGGDASRNELAKDGGKRAKDALAALASPAGERPAVAVQADRAKDDQYWSVVEQRANLEDDNARLREALTEIATLNRSRDQLQEMARSVLAGLQSTALTAEPRAVPEGMVLVPKEPTRDMCLAARRARSEHHPQDDADSPVVIWRAMIAASSTEGGRDGE